MIVCNKAAFVITLLLYPCILPLVKIIPQQLIALFSRLITNQSIIDIVFILCFVNVERVEHSDYSGIFMINILHKDLLYIYPTQFYHHDTHVEATHD